jgi:hypothetical protein
LAGAKLLKKFLTLLLLLNVAVFAYGYYSMQAAKHSAESERLRPINADAVKILTPQQVAKLGPAKVAQLTLACAEWGPFNEPERVKAMQLLEPMNLGRSMSARRVEITAPHWVYIPPKKDRAAAERAMTELKRLNVTDAVLLTEKGEWNWAISLGVFRTKEAADNRREELRGKGVKTMAYREREQTVTLTSLVLREPSQATLATLETARQQLPSSSVSTGACPENR